MNLLTIRSRLIFFLFYSCLHAAYQLQLSRRSFKVLIGESNFAGVSFELWFLCPAVLEGSNSLNNVIILPDSYSISMTDIWRPS